MESNNNTESEEKELSIKDILNVTKNYIREIKNNWKKIIPFILGVGLIFLTLHALDETTYPGKLTFLVNDEEGEDPTTSFTSVLRAFGGGKQNESSLEKVLQLFSTRAIIERTLFKKVQYNGKQDFLANMFIDTYPLKDLIGTYKSYIKNPTWVNNFEKHLDFRFTTDKIETFGETENITLLLIYEAIAGNENLGLDPLISSTMDEKSGIMSIGIKTISQDLTITILENLYNELSAYYVDKTVEKQSKIFEIVKFKADSIKAELSQADASLAKFVDSNRSLVWVTGELTKVRLERQARILEIMYGEVIKQVELADFALRKKTPYVQVIDAPKRPLRPENMSIMTSVLLTLVTGTILGLLYIIGKKIILENINS